MANLIRTLTVMYVDVQVQVQVHCFASGQGCTSSPLCLYSSTFDDLKTEYQQTKLFQG